MFDSKRVYIDLYVETCMRMRVDWLDEVERPEKDDHGKRGSLSGKSLRENDEDTMRFTNRSSSYREKWVESSMRKRAVVSSRVRETSKQFPAIGAVSGLEMIFQCSRWRPWSFLPNASPAAPLGPPNVIADLLLWYAQTWSPPTLGPNLRLWHCRDPYRWVNFYG